MMNHRWIESLASNEKAVNRLEHLLGHTLNNEDAMIFPSIEDAAEVFAIVWMAYTCSEMLEDQVANVDAGQRMISNVILGATETDEENDKFWFRVKGGDKPSDLRIETE